MVAVFLFPMPRQIPLILLTVRPLAAGYGLHGEITAVRIGEIITRPPRALTALYIAIVSYAASAMKLGIFPFNLPLILSAYFASSTFSSDNIWVTITHMSATPMGNFLQPRFPLLPYFTVDHSASPTIDNPVLLTI